MALRAVREDANLLKSGDGGPHAAVAVLCVLGRTLHRLSGRRATGRLGAGVRDDLGQVGGGNRGALAPSESGVDRWTASCPQS